jgi:predicted regulator of amino acid metabolism with ACT domain
MWNRVYRYFKSLPAQQRVVELLLRYGVRVDKARLYCGDIELSFIKVARAAGVDRRAVMSVVATIWDEDELRRIFRALQPTCNLQEMASELGWGVVEIIPVDASQPGILATVSSLIAAEGISIRQAIVDDVQLAEQPRLYIVTEGPLPGHLLTSIRESVGVRGVVAY